MMSEGQEQQEASVASKRKTLRERLKYMEMEPA
jgi:hypothetical protein